VSDEFRAPGETFRESESLQARLLAHAVGADVKVLDFIARAADAWDGRAEGIFSTDERRALCALGGLEPAVSFRPWRELSPDARRNLLFAARRSLELARGCAWVFGLGQGPAV
jgi:hypothetical protein